MHLLSDQFASASTPRELQKLQAWLDQLKPAKLERAAETANKRCQRVASKLLKQGTDKYAKSKYKRYGDVLAELKVNPLDLQYSASEFRKPALERKYSGENSPAALPLNPKLEKGFYIANGTCIKFELAYRGDYRGHFVQYITLHQYGNLIFAIKDGAGDEHIPGGELTFWYDLASKTGGGQSAAKEYKDNSFCNGKLEILASTLRIEGAADAPGQNSNPPGKTLTIERFMFTWENLGSVEFTSDV